MSTIYFSDSEENITFRRIHFLVGLVVGGDQRRLIGDGNSGRFKERDGGEGKGI